MKDSVPVGSRGLAVVLVLMVILAVTGLATIGLNLALAEARLAAAVQQRVGSDLLAEGAVALAMRAPPPAASDPSEGWVVSFDSVRTWSPGRLGASLQWLSTELALVRAWGRVRGAPAGRRIGALAWGMDTAIPLGPGMPGVAVGGAFTAPPGFTLGADSCGSSPGVVPGPAALPDRWTAPLDLALGWRGPRPPSARELDGLSFLDGEGVLLLLADGNLSTPDPVGPALAIAPGDLTLVPGADLAGLLLVAGDLHLAPTARFTGVARVLGRMTVEAGAEVVVSGCRAETGLRATGWSNGLRPVHGFVGLAPL